MDERHREARSMRPNAVPDVVVLRLPLYVRALVQLRGEGAETVSSQRLGSLLKITPVQIRKDLSYFGRFGKQGKGYNVRYLIKELEQILGLDREWRACLIGMGHLGQAIINYPSFAPEGFEILAAFDSDPEQVGTTVGEITVQPMSELSETVETKGVSIAIVAVPASEAQSVADEVAVSRIRGILNYTPVALQVPARMVIRNVDPVVSLQYMTYYLLLDGSSPG